MANKKFSDLTAAATLAAADIFAIENAGGNSRKITATNLASGLRNVAGFRGALVKKSADETGANYGSGVQIAWDSETYDTDSIHPLATTVTMTIASPCVVTWTSHNFAANTPIVFTTTGALPTGLTAGTTYYVLSPSGSTFNVSATPGGAAINTSGSQSGTHTGTSYSSLVVPSGVTYIRLTANVALANVTVDTYVVLGLFKNGSATFDGFTGQTVEIGTAGTPRASVSSPVLSVTAGDRFEARLTTEDTSIDITATQSSFSMEIVG